MSAVVKRHSPRRRLGGLLLLLFLSSLFALILAWDWNWFKGMIEYRVERATGRRLDLVGQLDVDPHWGFARVSARDVRFGNASWSKTRDMFDADAVEFDIRYWPLLRGDLMVPMARIQQSRLLLEREADRSGNWILERPSTGRRFEIGQLWVHEGKVRVRDAPLRTDFELDVESGQPSADDVLAPLKVQGSGRYRGLDLAIDGSIESPLRLRHRTEPYWVDMRARAGTTRAHARGTIGAMAGLTEFEVDFALRGTDLVYLEPLFGLVVPETPPYALDGRLRREGDVWYYRGVHGRIGDSDMRGDVTLDYRKERPHMRANLTSQQLDFDDLAGFVGLPPSTGPGESANAEQRREAAAIDNDDRLLPQHPYRIGRMRAMDADVTLRAAHVDAGTLPIESLEGRLELDRGVVRLKPLHLSGAGGSVDAQVELDASTEPIALKVDMTARGLELPKLFPDAELVEDSVGRIGGRVTLAGRGNSIAAMLGASDGDVDLVMGRGRISNLVLELAGLDVAETLRFMLGKDRVIPLRCAYANFVAEDGVLTTRTLVFDTTDTVILGEGEIDLGEERFDLVLNPRPKDRSILSLRSPLALDGSFKDPDIHPRGGPLILRGTAAAVLYGIAPPAALIALIETGPGEDSDCRGV